MKYVAKSFALALIMSAGLAGMADAKEKIVIGELSWDGALAIQNVLKVVMERNFDVEVEFINAEAAVIVAAMDKGNGAIDIYSDFWMPNQSERWAKFIAEGSRESVLVNDQPYLGTQGLFIPGYIQDKFGVRSVADLNDPEIAKLFDSDGDGKGEYWPGAPGWNSTNVEQVKANSYGYGEYFEPFIVADAAFKAKLKADFRRERGILFYYWTPEWIHAEFDLRRLEEPAFDGFSMTSKVDDPRYDPNGCWNMIQPNEDDDWLAMSRVTCSWPDAQVYIAYSTSLLERAPDVARLIKQVAFDPADVNSWILALQADGDPAEVAAEWVDANPDKVNEWLRGTSS